MCYTVPVESAYEVLRVAKVLSTGKVGPYIYELRIIEYEIKPREIFEKPSIYHFPASSSWSPYVPELPDGSRGPKNLCKTCFLGYNLTRNNICFMVHVRRMLRLGRKAQFSIVGHHSSIVILVVKSITFEKY